MIQLNNNSKKLIVILNDILISILSTYIALVIRYEDFTQITYDHVYSFIIFSFLFLPFFFYYDLYSNIIRYTNINYYKSLFNAFLFFLTSSIIIFIFFTVPYTPRSISIIQPVIFLFLIIISRIFAVQILKKIFKINKDSINTIIFGAGDNGAKLLSLIDQTNYNVIGFIDEDEKKIGRKINGKKIYNIDDIEQIKKKIKIELLLISINNLNIFKKNKITSYFEKHNIKTRNISSIKNIIEGFDLNEKINKININELLDRKINNNIPLLTFENKTILITGCGGSIGSELSIQILSLKPKKIILLDHSEYNLYKIHDELLQILNSQNIKILPILGSIQNSFFLENIFKNNKIDYIFHAAAYKHVPLIEVNEIEAIKNNFIGTINILKLVDKFEIQNFVLVSTDKAVRPTNIMGATKRMAELAVQAYASKIKGSKLCIVRFGNVIGSSGSVSEIFINQIKKGGPITITHPEVTRFFMTINEAVSLIIHSIFLSENGEVFILDMGKPIKIIDLAKKMILAYGLELKENNKEGDIEIIFTKLRPGEKLYEELLIGKNSEKTENPFINKAKEKYLKFDEFTKVENGILNEIENKNIKELIQILKQNVEGFNY